ncbi:MAG TPA: hypothetical protein PLU72_10155 [Candidatus Ozemobacteraceae bacterium]|nr:hypothetical protein [Candidatus Ozemobacteraceae bacterium]
MMCCAQCPLRPQSRPNGGRPAAAGGTGYTRPSLPEGLFVCLSPNCPRPGMTVDTVGNASAEAVHACQDCPQRQKVDLCPHDLWVVTGLARGDEFAARTAHHTLDTIVSCESEELACELFLTAEPETRSDLWHRMTACHPDRLDLLNQLFERLGLPPLDRGQWPDRIFDYRLAIA